MSSANYQSEIIIQLRKEIDRLGHVLRASQSVAFENQTEAFRLRAENERLRAALHPFAEAAGKFDPDEGDCNQHVWGWSPTIGMLRKARAALEGIRQYCIGGLSPIPAFDESTPYMQGYRRALENVQAYIEREQERITGDAMEENRE